LFVFPQDSTASHACVERPARAHSFGVYADDLAVLADEHTAPKVIDEVIAVTLACGPLSQVDDDPDRLASAGGTRQTSVRLPKPCVVTLSDEAGAIHAILSHLRSCGSDSHAGRT